LPRFPFRPKPAESAVNPTASAKSRFPNFAQEFYREIVCLDLEGVLVPEIWIEFSKRTGIPELMRTTRDEPDYDKLMKYRLNILREHKLGLPDIQKVIAEMGPMPGARASSTSCARITRSSSCPTPSTNSPTR
jgi:hypothetical protein